jgi:hypothetical protein
MEPVDDSIAAVGPTDRLLQAFRLSEKGFDAVSFWIYTARFAVSVAQFLYRLRVRRSDAPFWDEEEARHADWDRRGRQL